MVNVIGSGLARHHYLPMSWVHEDMLGTVAQLIVSLFIIGGLNVTIIQLNLNQSYFGKMPNSEEI